VLFKGAGMARERWVPLHKAKFRRIRGGGLISVRCQEYHHGNTLPTSLVEQYRLMASPSGRMQRAGQSMATLGFARGSQIAFAQTAAAIACPQCGSLALEFLVG
jgi:hypothetical protein